MTPETKFRLVDSSSDAPADTQLEYLRSRWASLWACWTSLQTRSAAMQVKLAALQRDHGRLVHVEQSLRAELADHRHGLTGFLIRGLLWTRRRIAPAESRRARLFDWSKRAAKKGLRVLLRKGRDVPALAVPPPCQPVAPHLNETDARLVAEILALPSRERSMGKVVDVIIPVEQGLTDALRCLRSVLTARCAASFDVLVVGSDVVGLRQIAADGRIALRESPAPPDLASAAERGLTWHLERDCVVVHPQVEVFAGWLDRLMEAGDAADVASVAPVSNHDAIDSVTAKSNDEICASENRRRLVEVAAGGGPVVYLPRAFLKQAGTPVLEAGPREFCLRAEVAGWRHLLATDTFVTVAGATCLEAESAASVQQTLAALTADAGRVGPRPALLLVCHGQGGGTVRHAIDMAKRWETEGVTAFLLSMAGTDRVRLERPALADGSPRFFDLPGEYWPLHATLQRLDLRHVHIHHTIGVPEEVFELLRDLVPQYDITLHDYYSVCPRIQLIDDSGAYCGEPNEIRCNVCIQSNGGYGGIKPEIRAWREQHRQILAGARKVFVPHADVAERLGRYFPDVAITVRPHFEQFPGLRPVGTAWQTGEPLRVAILGVLGPHKGSRIVAACARHALANQLPLEFHIVGYVDSDPDFPVLPNVSITGPYREEQVFDVLEPLRCHCAFFASVWPETYSYTLSIALAGRLFPVIFDLGAPAARLRQLGVGHRIPLTKEAAVINEELLRLRDHLQEMGTGRWDQRQVYSSLADDYYEFPPGQAPFARPLAG